MPALLLDRCFGCIELRLGCFILGCLELVADIILISMGIKLCVAEGKVAAALTLARETSFTATLKHYIDMRVVVCSIMVVIFFHALFFTLILLYGVNQKRRDLIKAHLFFRLIFLALGGRIGNISTSDENTGLEINIASIFIIILGTYSFLVVRSYYYKLDDESRSQAIPNAANLNTTVFQSGARV